ncbi:hypothetical protein FEM48_Zijuj07G0149800 [Ziziphus jujuba var. spinosa]|uniref:Amidase domain-containing protein n=1 Tax=Ziziphus jujuba var. spinosa TaxID=714518 RepID=A0A978V5B2_ZIZJJ|nr:hypothetical protein FEM48_Zijuj07G0149800 [Ziziphus jujuba var. spinosa]
MEIAYETQAEVRDMSKVQCYSCKEYGHIANQYPLHGIPYGLKDKIRLKSVGVVLVAKPIFGSLAYDDIWFDGRSRNPWNIEELSIEMVPYAIGSELVGSMLVAHCGMIALHLTRIMQLMVNFMHNLYNMISLDPFAKVPQIAIILDTIKRKDPDDLSSIDVSLDDPFSLALQKLLLVILMMLIWR